MDITKNEDSGLGTVLAVLAIIVGIFLILFQPLIWWARRWYHWFFGVLLILSVEISAGYSLYNWGEAKNSAQKYGEVVEFITNPTKTNLRSSPEISDNVLVSVPRGTRLSALASQGSWKKAEYSGETVYVHQSTVKNIREKLPKIGPFPDALSWVKWSSVLYIIFLGLLFASCYYNERYLPEKEAERQASLQCERIKRIASGQATEEDNRYVAHQQALLAKANVEEDLRLIALQEKGVL